MEENNTSSTKHLLRGAYPDDAAVARAEADLRRRRPEFAQLRLSPEALRFVKRWPYGVAWMALEEAFECAAHAGRSVVLAIDVPFI